VLIIGVDTGNVYALDIDTGCEHWVFQAPAGVRTAPALGMVDGEWRVFFGDRGAVVYAIDALQGQLRWQREVDSHQAAILTGSPALVTVPDSEVRDRLLVPVSSSEEGIAAVPTYPCCTFRGSLASLDARDGSVMWQTYSINETPRETGDNTFGPSGGAFCSPASADGKHKRVCVASGDAYSKPVEIGTDALIGI